MTTSHIHPNLMDQIPNLKNEPSSPLIVHLSPGQGKSISRIEKSKNLLNKYLKKDGQEIIILDTNGKNLVFRKKNLNGGLKMRAIST